MARHIDPKCKLCRREGEKLYLKGDRCFTPKCSITRRSYAPGVHGPNSKTRPTQYGLQLREKQKAKNIYGIMERQFSNYFEKATKRIGDTGAFLVQLLEMRLDNIVFRSGLTKSRALARQLVTHGHITVNGKKVSVPSYQVKEGDIIGLDATIGNKVSDEDKIRLEKHQAPAWLRLEAKDVTAKVLHVPQGDELKQSFDPTKIVEFYSR
jgi:small subunit ribosomal protein S4